MADRDERNECLAPEERAVPRDQTELIKCGENQTEHRVRDISVKPREQATRAEPVEPPQWSSKEPSMMETMMRIKDQNSQLIRKTTAEATIREERRQMERMEDLAREKQRVHSGVGR